MEGSIVGVGVMYGVVTFGVGASVVVTITDDSDDVMEGVTTVDPEKEVSEVRVERSDEVIAADVENRFSDDVIT